VPEFDEKKIHLQRFITAIKLVDLAKGPYEEIDIEVIKSKTSIASILNKLQTIIVGKTSQNVKLATVQQRGKTATQLTTEIDHLRKQLEAVIIKKTEHEHAPQWMQL